MQVYLYAATLVLYNFSSGTFEDIQYLLEDLKADQFR